MEFLLLLAVCAFIWSGMWIEVLTKVGNWILSKMEEKEK